jgi:Cephalosporin hydroxylase
VETGTAHGGSALCLATLCEATGHGEVVSVDIGEWPDRPRHPRLTYLTASSTDPAAVERVAQRARGARTVLVVLDSDHRRDHILAELYAYAPLVTPGSYLVVEDTNVNGHPVYEEFGPGRWRRSRTSSRTATTSPPTRPGRAPLHLQPPRLAAEAPLRAVAGSTQSAWVLLAPKMRTRPAGGGGHRRRS